MRVRLVLTLAFFTACLTIVGCGTKGVVVTGKVVNGAKGYTPATDGDMNITLGESGKTSYTGKVETDGTFTIKSGEGGPVPHGSYKVTVTRYPTAAEMKPGTPPMPKNLTYPDNWEVSGSSNTFTLDAAKLK